MLTQIEQKNLKNLRKEMWEEQNKRCPILNKEILFEESVVDHQHMTSKENIGENGAGLIRGVLHFQSNAWEGKVVNSFRRIGLHKKIDLVSALRNLADYLEQENTSFIHPNEKPKEKKILKRPFNKIKKLYSMEYPKRKSLEFPKSGKATKQLKELSKKYNINLYGVN